MPEVTIGFEDIPDQMTHESRQQSEELTTLLPLEPCELRNELFKAIECNKAYRVTQLLTAKADPNTQDEQGNTPVMTAVLQDKCDILQSLIDHKADVNVINDDCQTKTDHEKISPLLAAAKNKNKNAILTLLKAGADPKTKADAMTPLHYGVFYEQPEIVKSLLEYKASPNQRFYSGLTLFGYAQCKQDKSIEDALDAAGASHIPDAQQFLIKRMQKTGLNTFEDGVCFGLVCAAIQNYFNNDLQRLLDQIESIARTPIDNFKSFAAILKKNRTEWLQRALTEVCDALTKQSGLLLTTDKLWLNQLSPSEIKTILNITKELDEHLLHEQFSQFLIKKVYEKVREYRAAEINAHPELDIPYIFEGIDAYLFATWYLDLYPKGYVVDTQNFLQTLPLFAPIKLNPEDITRLDSITGIYTKSELEFYFTSLYDAFKKYPGKIAFKLGNLTHFIVLFPSPTRKDVWQLLDPNMMPIFDLSKEELTECILESFNSKQMSGINLEILVHRKELTIANECLQQWKSHPTWQAMHTITQNKAQMVDEFKYSLLRFAVVYNDLPLIKTLLGMGVNPDYAHKKGMTALRVAAQNGNVEIIKLLQAHGASLTTATDDGDTPLHLAAQVGQAGVIKYLLEEGVDVNLKTNSGYTALHTVAINNHVDTLSVLIEAKADINQTVSSNGQSPLSLAAEEGHVEMVNALLNRYAVDGNSVDILNSNALYYAAKNNHLEVVQRLIEADGIEFRKQHKSSLLVAVEKGHIDIVTYFLNVFPDQVNSKFGLERTLLMLAAFYGHFDLAKVLILEAKADPRSVDTLGHSALYFAVENSSYEIVELLLKSGVNLNQNDTTSTTMLENAIENKRTNIATILLQYGAKPTDKCLFEAVKTNNIELVKLLQSYTHNSSAPVTVSPYLIQMQLEMDFPDRVPRFEQFLKDKSLEHSIENYDLIEVSALELANIMGNSKIIQSLQNHSLFTNNHVFLNQIRMPVSQEHNHPAGIIMQYSEDTNDEVREEIERVLGKA